MRISNIKQYLGGADNVIARDIIEGDQFTFNFKVGTTNLANYTFEVDTQLFTADVTTSGSNITINTLEPASANLVNGGKNTYPTTGATSIITKSTDNLSADLLIPSTLLSDVTSANSTPDSTKPFIVAMSVSLIDSSAITATSGSKRTFRLLWVVRYRPMAS